jgi:hypothetical protein
VSNLSAREVAKLLGAIWGSCAPSRLRLRRTPQLGKLDPLTLDELGLLRKVQSQ